MKMCLINRLRYGFILMLMFFILIAGCGQEKPAIEVVSTETSSNNTPEPGSIVGSSIEDFPDNNLIDQDGEPVSIDKLPNKPLLISFIYTRCPMKSMCPRVTDQIATIQDRVNQNGQKPVEFVLVTFDPEYDRPDVLKQYANRYQVDYDNLSLWTGERKTIDKFVESFKIMVIRDGDQVRTHNMRTYLIDRERVIRNQFRGSDWTVDDVMQPLWKMI